MHQPSWNPEWLELIMYILYIYSVMIRGSEYLLVGICEFLQQALTCKVVRRGAAYFTHLRRDWCSAAMLDADRELRSHVVAEKSSGRFASSIAKLDPRHLAMVYSLFWPQSKSYNFLQIISQQKNTEPLTRRVSRVWGFNRHPKLIQASNEKNVMSIKFNYVSMQNGITFYLLNSVDSSWTMGFELWRYDVKSA
jgi:hypothetical protein